MMWLSAFDRKSGTSFESADGKHITIENEDGSFDISCEFKSSLVYPICIVSPDGAIGMTGTYVEDENDPGSIDWIYITKERELEELPDHIQGLNIIYMD